MYDEQKYFDYLKGKNIILVGPANFLVGKNRGKQIDDYDLVVRMNFSVPVEKNLRSDFGQRTDILYKRLLKQINKEGNYYPTPEEIKMWRKIGINWVVVIGTNNMEKTSKFGEMMNGILPWTVTGNIKGQIKREIKNKRVLAGLISVVHMLKAPIKSLTVTNCTFYDTGYYAGYRGLKGKDATKDTDRSDFDVLEQLRFLNKIKQKDGRLIFDDYLENMVKENKI